MQIEHQFLDINKMETKDLIDLVQGIRASRVTEKEQTTEKIARVSKVPSKKNTKTLKMIALMGTLSSEDMKALANELKKDPAVLAALKAEQKHGNR